jgi:hypothetical protein
MTRVSGASWLASIVALGIASVADGATLPNTVQWNFVGTASVVIGDPACCQPVVSDGQQVLGSLTVTNSFFPPNPAIVASNATVDVFSLDGTQHLLGVSFSFVSGEVAMSDGQPAVPGSAGSPDELLLLHPYVDGHDIVAAEIGLQPGWELIHDPQASFELIDQDGLAWSGVDPQTGVFLTNKPPDASLFETRQLELAVPVNTTPALGTDAIITIHVDQFLPEPEIGPLVSAALMGFCIVAVRRTRSRSS